MSLRTKLLLSFLVLVAALVALGVWSARGLYQLGEVSERIISNNYDSVVAAQDMKESLERQDSALLFAILGETERAENQVREYRLRFDRALARASNNITEPGEARLIERITADRAEYYRLFDELISTIRAGAQDSSRTPQNRQTYFSQLEPLFTRLRGNCDELLRLNQAAMLDKSDAARAAADRWFRQLLLFAGLLVLASTVLAIFLSERIVRPVRELTATTAQLAGGNLDARARVASHDEIGLLAAEYNRMAERIRQLRRSDKGKLLIAQTIGDQAINALNEPLIVTDLEGRITKLNCAAESIFGSSGETIGKQLSEIKADDHIALTISNALSSKQIVVAEDAVTLSSKENQEIKSFRVRATPLIDTENTLLGVVTMFEDISHLHRFDQDKAQFFDAVADELREPLTRARLGLHVLLEGATGELDEKQREILYAARADCEKVDEVLNQLAATETNL